MLSPIVYDEIRVGEVFGPVEFLADEKLVKEYCDDYEDHNPIYLEESPFGGPVVPPALRASLQGQRTLATRYDMHATVPTKSTHEYIHPAKVGKRLITTGRLTAKYVKRGREYVVIESSTVDEDSVHIRQSMEHIALRMEKRASTELTGQDQVLTRYGLEETLWREDSKAGRSVSASPVKHAEKIPSLKKIAYQRTLHDQVFLPDSIHDTEYARSQGYTGALVSGYVLCAYMSEMLVNFFGPTWLQGGEISLIFMGGVQEGDKLTCCGTVVDKITQNAGALLHLDIWMEKTQGSKVVVGKATG